MGKECVDSERIVYELREDGTVYRQRSWSYGNRAWRVIERVGEENGLRWKWRIKYG